MAEKSKKLAGKEHHKPINSKQWLADELKRLHACEEAIQWCGSRTLKQAWKECQRGDWMVWYLRNTNRPVTQEQWVKIAIESAKLGAHSAKGEEVQRAIDAVEDWLRRPCKKTFTNVVLTACDIWDHYVTDITTSVSADIEIYAVYAAVYTSACVVVNATDADVYAALAVSYVIDAKTADIVRQVIGEIC